MAPIDIYSASFAINLILHFLLRLKCPQFFWLLPFSWLADCCSNPVIGRCVIFSFFLYSFLFQLQWLKYDRSFNFFIKICSNTIWSIF